jgi:hypothetical protein
LLINHFLIRFYLKMGVCCNSDSKNEEESRGRAELNANKIVL